MARRVVLYGNNLLISAIAARLQERPELELCRIQGTISEMTEQLAAATPDVIVFDSAAQPEFAVHSLKQYPAALLVGVDLTSNKMLVLSGQQSKLVTAEDLLKVIEPGAAEKAKETLNSKP